MNASFKNRKWSVPQGIDAATESILITTANPYLAPILAARGMKPEEAASFLEGNLKTSMPHPMSFKDMAEGVERVRKAIEERERIAIWTDYDVDGATSGAIIGRFLEACGVDDYLMRVPDRITEGYGPNSQGISDIKEAGYDLLMILDAGTVAFEPLEHARAIGLDVVVIDHHAAEPRLPPACAVINPNRKDESGTQGHICAAGMCLLFTFAAVLEFRKAGVFERLGIKGPSPFDYMDMAALGTVADVVPLIGFNRAVVKHGLKALSERRTPGIRALAEVSDCREEITVYNCGFQLGPRINAGGRIGASDSGVKLLLCKHDETARDMAENLNRLNAERQKMEGACTAQAMEQLEGKFQPGVDRKIAIAVTNAHEGIVGITASRVKEAMDAPALVLTTTEDGFYKGSARSVTGFDIGEAIIAAKNAGLLVKGGGHGMAGGLTMETSKLEEFRRFMNERIAKSDYARDGVVTRADLVLPAAALDMRLIRELDKLAPFGTGNPNPRVMLEGLYVASVRVIKERHLKVDLRLKDGPSLEMMIWNYQKDPIGQKMAECEGRRIDAIGKLSISEFAGKKTIQIGAEDVRFAASKTHEIMFDENRTSDLFGRSMAPPRRETAPPF